MNPRLLDLREERGRLRARSEMLRQNIAARGKSLAGLCGAFDRLQSSARWVKQHPYSIGLGVALLALLKPRRIWPALRWGARLFLLRRGWRRILGRWQFLKRFFAS
jgi:hypothetical protein